MSAMYLQNKYTRWYYNIIQRAQTRTISIYTERHHIIPKSLGGSNDKTNLVDLTAREHFVCHWLLTKMVSGQFRYPMWNAFSCMLYRKNDHQQRYKITSKIFENIKKDGSKIKSERFSGVNNPMYGKKRSIESKQKQSASSRGKEVSAETREKLRTSRKYTGPNYKLRGNNNAMHKQDTKEKRESYFLEKYGVRGPGLVCWVCEHCGKQGTGLINQKRWHGDNCKSLKSINS